jgi:hypothetical protein
LSVDTSLSLIGSWHDPRDVVGSLTTDRIFPPRVEYDDPMIDRAMVDPKIFIDRFCWVVPAEGGAPVPFTLWDFQDEVVDDFRDPEHPFVVVLKARQLGLSWLALAYGLWLTNCNPGMTFLILNRKLGAAIELLERIRFIHHGHRFEQFHKGLPDGLRTRIVQDTNDPTQPMIQFENGSRIISLPSTEDSGSGLTAQFILADEVAKWPWAAETFTAILATIAGGGKLVAISTAKGTSNYFAQLWTRAQPGAETPNDYWPIFIPSSAHPARDDEWLQAESRKYPSLRKFQQEHPEKWQDAFQLADDAVFNEFDRQDHHKAFTRETQWPVWRGIDFGYHFAPVYWIEVQANRVAHVFSELDVREQTTDQLATELVDRDRHLRLETTAVPAGVDPAGKARTSQGGTQTDHLTLNQHGVMDLRMIEPSNPTDRVDQIKKLLREDRLFIDCTACPRLAEALEQAQWVTTRDPTTGGKIRGETYAKDGRFEHYLDALGYALANIWPSVGAPAGAPAQTGPAAPRRNRYGSSEFS